jgi:hypothetical protein
LNRAVNMTSEVVEAENRVFAEAGGGVGGIVVLLGLLGSC